MEALRASLQTQEVELRALIESVDRRFQAFKRHFDKIVDRFYALGLGARRGRNKERRRLRDDVAQGQPVNRPVSVYNRKQPVYSDDSEKEDEFVFADHKHARDGRNVRDFDRDGGDFRLKMDIPYFNSNLNIKDFIDQLADIDKFFDYMEDSEEKACKLKGGASAWQERQQTRRSRKGRQPVRTWYRMK